MTHFALLERRVNRRCGEVLANAIATVDGWDYAGIYEARNADALVFGTGSVPTFSGTDLRIETDDAIHITSPDGALLFDGTVKQVERDGSGWALLSLQEVD